MEQDIEQIRGILSNIADYALHGLAPVDGSSVRSKQDAADLVSNRDLAMESKIIEFIHEVFPNHTVVSEEVGMVGSVDAEDVWMVDPIDGSCNDSHGIPWSCVSAAYVHAGRIIAGIIVQPSTGEVFQAIAGRGATLTRHAATQNGATLAQHAAGQYSATSHGEASHGAASHPSTIRIATKAALPGSVVMTELLNQTPWPGMYGFIDHLAGQDATVRIMGSSALAITQVAAGRAAAAVLGQGGSLDVAASLLIAMEAGALVWVDGKPFERLPKDHMNRLVVACPEVIDAVWAMIREE